jgi:mRNA interferase RelE/StbE
LAWTVEFLASAKKSLKKLDRPWQKAILDYLENEIAVLDDPRSRGKALTGEKRGLWRYRVGDYRIICDIEDSRVTILAVAIGHRREVYDD